MALLVPMGPHTPRVRCFAIAESHVTRILHLKSRSKFEKFEQIRETVRQAAPEGEKAALFIKREHLPDELSQRLGHIEAFRRSCNIVGFSDVTFALNAGEGLPAPQSDAKAARWLPCDGFPITKPVEKIDVRISHSYGEDELRSFLGKFYPHAGKMIFLSLSRLHGDFGINEYRPIVRRLIQILENPNFPLG